MHRYFLANKKQNTCHHHQIDAAQSQTIQMEGGARNAKSSSHWTVSGREIEHTSASFMHGPGSRRQEDDNLKIQSS